MQHMSDKELDHLFKDKFNDAEIEPSADLWAKIAPQLPTKSKRKLPFMWMAAASVLVTASVILSTKKDEKIFLQPGTVDLAAVTTDLAVPVALKPVTVTETTTTELPDNMEQTPVVKTYFATAVVTEKVEVQKNNEIAMQPAVAMEHLPYKKPAVELAVIEKAVEVPVDTKIMYAQADLPNTEYADLVNEPSSSKKGIRNMGDLINYVVDKVDKRDKKLIKFNTDDDDNSSIIGLNIGFVKLNKRDK